MEPSEKQVKSPSPDAPHDTDQGAAVGSPKRISSLYVIGFLILATFIVGFIWQDLRADYRDTLSYWKVQLSSSADEQATVGALWLKERRTDTTAIAENPSTIRLLAAKGDKDKAAALRQQVEGEIAHMAAVNGFLGGAVGDGDCQITVQTGLRPEMAQGVQEACRRVQQSGEYEIDAFGMEKGHIWLNLSAPVKAEGPASPSAPLPRRIVGSVVMVTELWQNFILIFGGESIPTKTSETLIVWKESSEALIYSPRRSARGGPSFFRRALAGPTFESRVAREGDVAFGEFIDYRGVRVFGAARRIPPDGDSLVCKVDWDEALAQYRLHLVLDWLVGALMLLLLTMVMVALHRHAAMRDLEERIRQQEALLELKQHIEVSEERFRELVESADAIVWEADAATQRITFVSQGAEKILGYPKDQWLQTASFWADHLHPEDREAALACEREVTEKGSPRSVEYRMKAAEGRVPWFRDSMHAVAGPEGKVEQLRGIMVDITESKRAEEELRLTEFSLKHASDSAFWVDSQGRIVYANEAACRSLERSREELLSLMIPDIHPVSSREAWASFWEEVKVRGSMTFETEHQTKQGRVFPVEVTANYLEFAGKEYSFAFARDITEHKRAEAALRGSEQFIREVVASAQEGIVVYDREFRYQVWNPFMEELTGTPASDVLGKVAFDVFPYLREHNAGGLRERALAGEVVQTPDTPFRVPATGRSGLVSSVFSPHYGASGEILGVIGAIRDVTERHQTEEKLRLAQFSLDRASDSILWTDSQGRILYANESACRSLGRSCEELLSLTIPEIDPLFSKEAWGAYWENLKTRGSLIFETQQVRKQGGVSPIEVTANYREFDGKGYSFAFGRDITERKRAEEALRESEERFRLFMNNSPSVAWMKDAQGRYIYINEPYQKHFGIRLEDRQGKTDFEVYPRAIAEQFRNNDQAALNAGHPIEVIEESLSPDGKACFWLAYKFPFQDASGQVFVAGIGMDISERKRAEEERQRSFDQLRGLAARLQSIREEERKRVARYIHDQLGQALTAIKIDLSSLVHELPAGETQPLKRTSSMLKLVEESIHAVRRISTELRPGILDDLGLVAAIEWAGEDFESRTGTPCRLDLPPESIAVDAERATAIFRIFQETLTNVARHADASQVEVRMAREDGDLTLEVHDNGKGITADQLSNRESLGILGMRERAMLLGGELTIGSPSGNGTRVRVRIPEAAQI